MKTSIRKPAAIAAAAVMMALPLAAGAQTTGTTAADKPTVLPQTGDRTTTGTNMNTTRPATTTGGGTAAVNTPGTDRLMYSDRSQLQGWNDEKTKLEQALRVGEGRQTYLKTLRDRGYLVTSINEDKADYLEYEVVKDGRSYEVQIDLDNAVGKKIDVTTNMWRADATKAAMRGGKTVGDDIRYVPTNVTYSDRARMKNWGGEKERLEKALGTGHDKGWYAAELRKMGYQVTSTNDAEKDYVEYEIVKGDNTYEVQIDFENGKSKKVDVTTNMWQSDATDKALATTYRK